MSNRLFLAALVVGIQIVALPLATAADAVTVKVFPFTGEVQLVNEFGTPAEFVFYSITSATASLHSDDGVWLSISDVYDVSGNGFIDPVNEWVEFTPTLMKLGEQVAEGAPHGSGGVLPPYRGISLGRILDPDVHYNDLTVVMKKADETELMVDPEDAIAGDYNEDREVDMADYDVWKMFFGAPFFFYLADGNLNGVLDAADYTVWRDNLGKKLSAAGGEGAGGSSVGLYTAGVPEPASLLLAIGVGSGVLFWPRRRPLC